tara:strand:- start:1495 stop:2034 length:540 start_codon:yes stop_codon:yes gene_type:complete
MNRPSCKVLGVACVLAASVTAHAVEDELRVIPLVRSDNVLVSFELPDAYNDNVRETISSGLTTTFTYVVDLRQIVPFWVDRTVATAVVSVTNAFDNLTGRHNLTRTVDGQIIDSIITEDEEIVKQWLTTFTRLSLCRTSRLAPNHDYYVRVDARGRPNGSSALGWASAFSGQTRFTFIP